MVSGRNPAYFFLLNSAWESVNLIIDSYEKLNGLYPDLQLNKSYPVFVYSNVVYLLTDGNYESNSKGILSKVTSNSIDFILMLGSGSRIASGRYNIPSKTVSACYIYHPTT